MFAQRLPHALDHKEAPRLAGIMSLSYRFKLSVWSVVAAKGIDAQKLLNECRTQILFCSGYFKTQLTSGKCTSKPL